MLKFECPNTMFNLCLLGKTLKAEYMEQLSIAGAGNSPLMGNYYYAIV